MIRNRVFLTLILSATALQAQSIGILKQSGQQSRVTKAENGLIISWVDIPISVASNEKDNVEAGQVDIYHENGQLITSFNVLRPVDGARAVSIYDVSAQPGGPIAVAAVYVSEKGDRNVPPPAASLCSLTSRDDSFQPTLFHQLDKSVSSSSMNARMSGR